MNSARTNASGVVIPPPILYLSAFLIGCIIQAALPLALFSSTLISWPLGLCFLIPSGAFARWAFVTMRRVGTSASHRKPSAALSTEGPFRISRNPIYVAMTGLYLGAVFLVNSVWPLLLLVPLILLMHWGVILKEERYLSGQFGDAYSAYKSAVRRWL
ncbi:MAG: isoprenylcysteine carboxylmethyltransferase family protein [Gammaproteobacteria bacterium]|nr:isoprenylcysteine carboxylmethyltransferase family protein [Gammaproteobacteria bacterium]